MQQDALFTEQTQNEKTAGPVTCLGKTFVNDAERRAYFTALLAEKLKDPEFRKIEGFPIGSDEDILNLSDPPYYTACPNPWIADFIAQWEAEKPEQPEGYHYHREPFAADVSEGKNDPIYNAHSYHTKVPHKAIMRYILHYTNPGDIVFDGFCGTGMTGVAAQMCGDRSAVMALGYQIKSDGTILLEETDETGKLTWQPFSKLGARKAVLNDLSTAATFISCSYNTPTNIKTFTSEAIKMLEEVEKECVWMYKTKHSEGTEGEICYTIWSDVFYCHNCFGEVVFYDAAINKNDNTLSDTFECPHCSAFLAKKTLERVWCKSFDEKISEETQQAKQVPVLINYTFSGKRFNKKPDSNDLLLMQKIQEGEIPYWFPDSKIPDGFNTRQPIRSHGLTNVHHFYTKRNLWILSALWHRARNPWVRRVAIWLSGGNIHLNKMRRWQPLKPGGTPGLPGTLYVCATPVELSVFDGLPRKLRDLKKSLLNESYAYNLTATGSMSGINVPSNSMDYIFIDPPFGANLNYSELNFIWESWLGVKTNIKHEAIENNIQGKTLDDYRALMTSCFRKAYEVLKPGRWMTVEFSNTKSAVWNSIQTALNEAGFIVANVSALDKKQGSFKAVTTTTAVKQDLVISAYKPNGGFEDRFKDEAKTEAGVWDFIRTHLQYLPVIKLQGNSLLQIPERDPRILFDQVVTYYVRKGYHLPISSQEFQAGLAQRFVERDGMYFLDEQAAEYDKKKAIVGELVQISLFVKDEASAIQWLRQLLKLKPQVFSDINPLFMQQLSGWSKNEVQLDLRELLNQNFLCYDGKDEVPDQIHSYLSTNWKELRNLAKTAPELKAKAKDRWYVPDPNKAGDLEKLRERSLLKEFEEYKTAKKKLKVFRIEAVRAGFKKLWEAQEFASILEISTKLPNDVIAEDPILLMYYDQAMMLSQNNSTEDW
ncbi:site-specific DNA-methyltransferase [Shewanella baltica]|uniref:site-specific DNA-methyltransferase n=1 Tax=Shewanella baltica TaxID=62322 RepID=UPI00217E4470|nr:site-specific DNA-methyltransferase [Shewanella baltica]MCS6095702.1 site-specific DNA-methyltransferase [Shewanella baltica]MCS6226837.1 site-specific DNA-methyltransferase [Shewanella baltica]